ncbi:MAG: ribonucleotide-diphosphate reductase subunit alpha, partial [Candidimonas sp.]
LATCILSAINVGQIKSLEEMETLCDLAVRGLESIIDHQNYPLPAAESYTKDYRSLGVGFIGLAHYLAKNKVKYTDPAALQLVHELTEAFQYYLLKASCSLAKEKGPAKKYPLTKYARGLLPIDHYKKEIDELVSPTYRMDWENLRKDIAEHGLRHCTLSAQMPSESSSLTSNATNGVEPPRDFISVKKSKKGPLKQVVPEYHRLKNQYTLLWDDPMINDGYVKIMGVIQKFFDQAISSNTSYNPEHYENKEIPTSVFARDILMAYKYGLKTLYYHNTYDGMTDEDEKPLPELEKSEEISDEEHCESCAI